MLTNASHSFTNSFSFRFSLVRWISIEFRAQRDNAELRFSADASALPRLQAPRPLGWRVYYVSNILILDHVVLLNCLWPFSSLLYNWIFFNVQYILKSLITCEDIFLIKWKQKLLNFKMILSLILLNYLIIRKKTLSILIIFLT